MPKHSHQSTINDTLFRKKGARGIPLVEQEQPLEEGLPEVILNYLTIPTYQRITRLIVQ